jgi:hypothetical protein
VSYTSEAINKFLLKTPMAVEHFVTDVITLFPQSPAIASRKVNPATLAALRCDSSIVSRVISSPPYGEKSETFTVPPNVPVLTLRAPHANLSNDLCRPAALDMCSTLSGRLNPLFEGRHGKPS